MAHCKFSKEKFVDFAYHWLLGCKGAIIGKALGMSAKTVTDWSNYLRESVTSDLLLNDDCQIGGPGITVEIDESKFGKRKYHVSLCVVPGDFFGLQFSLRNFFSTWAEGLSG